MAIGVEVDPFAILVGPLEIGEHARIGAFSVIGAPPKKRLSAACGTLRVGARVVIGESVIIDAGTTVAGASIEEATMILPHVYLGHDANVGRSVTIASHAQIGGRVTLQQGANVGLGAAIHQSVTIGAYAMVGMHAVVSRDVPPFALAKGMPARVFGLNRVACARLQLNATTLDRIAGFHHGVAEIGDHGSGLLGDHDLASLGPPFAAHGVGSLLEDFLKVRRRGCTKLSAHWKKP
ncbi:MAG: hypothetical protein NVSMB1_14340 [Polyangiales bacterium]